MIFPFRSFRCAEPRGSSICDNALFFLKQLYTEMLLQVGDLIRQQELETADLGLTALAATTEEPVQASPEAIPKAPVQQVCIYAISEMEHGDAL